jgi:membrane protein implicated in regulation of membrane protease activity
MAYWPKTLRGNVLTVLLIVVGLPLLVFLAMSLSGPWVWAGLALVALTWVALYIWRRRIQRDRERAWVGAFSFGDMIESMRAREAVDHAPR